MKNIFIGVNPNIQADDISLVIKQIFQPWKWQNDEIVYEFENRVEEYMGQGFKAVAFDSARSSLAILLKEYGIRKGDEVIVPSFTCVVVINAVLRVGATPVYIDTDPKTFNIDIDKLKEKVTPKTKAILVQHSFGVALDVRKVKNIVGEDVKIIEDVAHILGGENQNGQKYGTLGDAAILTFGIEKMMTTLRGGMVLVKDEELYQSLKHFQKKAPHYSKSRIFTWLLNPLIWAIAAPFYFIGFRKFTIGRMISQVGHKLGLMGNMMEACEYKGEWPAWLPSRMPGAFAKLGLNQLKKLDNYNEHRREIARIYDEKLGLNYGSFSGYTPLRYPVLVTEPGEVLNKLKEKHVIAGNWYHKFLFTDAKFLEYLNFNPSNYPKTQKITEHIVNLPVFIKVSKDDAEEIAHVVKPYLKS